MISSVNNSFQVDGYFGNGLAGYYYKRNVLKRQYLLADQDLLTCVMQKSTQSRDVAYEAVCLVSSVHQFKTQNQGVSDDINRQYDKLRPMLAPRRYTVVDAMAALHVISSLLFIGGKGEWPDWLNVAYVFADSILRTPRSLGAAQILKNCDDGLRHIIKTAMWFDVLASACLFKSPHFLQEYRDLFAPPDAHIANLPAAPEP